MAVHKIVAIAFLENIHNYKEVDHLDFNRSNNAVTNLKWTNHIDNVRRSSNQGRYLNKGTKAILQYDLQGNLIKEWQSGTQIQKELGISSKNVSACCHNKRKTHKGYVWKFKDFYEEV